MSKATQKEKRAREQANSVKTGRTKMRWDVLDANLSGMPTNRLREFYGAAAKFLIPRQHWTSRHPVTGMDHRPEIASFHVGFGSWSVQDLRNEAYRDTVELLKTAANYRGESSLPYRSAARRLTALRKKMAQRFVRFVEDERRPERGLRYYRRQLIVAFWRDDVARATQRAPLDS